MRRSARRETYRSIPPAEDHRECSSAIRIGPGSARARDAARLASRPDVGDILRWRRPRTDRPDTSPRPANRGPRSERTDRGIHMIHEKTRELVLRPDGKDGKPIPRMVLLVCDGLG